MNTAQGSLLIVDDDRQNRLLLAARLKSAGHVTAMAENGRQALEMLRAQPFDLVLLDLLMPEMDGYQVLARLQADDTLRHMPVLVLSAADDMDSIVRCIEMGAVDYLPQPFNPVLLHARVGACLEKKHLHDQQVTYLQQFQTLIMDKSKEVMRAEASSLFMLDQEAGLLRFHVARGTAGATLRSATVALGHGIAGWVAQTGEPLLIPDAYQEPRFDPSYDKRSGFRTRSILTVPLKVKAEVTGVVQVINKIGEVAFGQHDLNLFLSFASQASVALDNARLYERTKAMAADLRQALEQERRLTIEKEKMRAYIPKQLVDEISRNREQQLALGGKTVHLTILFSDIQGFTRLSETMASQQVISFLNTYMTAMTGIIEEEGGIIDKFIGDGIMALFLPTSEDDNHALRAVRAGIRMQKRLYSLQKEWAASRPELAGMQIRVGVNTGEVVSGNIGSETRMDYTVVGDNVNVASRLESVSRAGEVCISDATYREIEGHIAATKLEPVYVKNRVQPVHVYTVQVAPDGEV
jgi:adenylate cyclase